MAALPNLMEPQLSGTSHVSQGLFIDSISVGGERIELNRDQIVCFVGPNSSGKSRALNWIFQSAIQNQGVFPPSIVDGLTLACPDDKSWAENLVEERAHVYRNKICFVGGQEQLPNQPNARDWFIAQLSNINGRTGRQLFFQRLEINQRIGAVGSTNRPNYPDEFATNPLQGLFVDEDAARRLSDFSQDVFDVPITISPGVGQNISLKVGAGPDPESYRPGLDVNYLKDLDDLPNASEGGDGFKAAIGLMASLYTTKCDTIFLDEPDVYLHPPQAYQLGRSILDAWRGRQIFMATHNYRFLQGVFDEARERLLLIRLSGEKSRYSARIVDKDALAKISADAVMKFSNILDGLFYKRVILCEDPSDCLFYRHAADALAITSPKDAVLWIGVHGKKNFRKFVDAANALTVPVSVVADFDILNQASRRFLSELPHSLGGQVEQIIRHLDAVDSIIRNNGKVDWESLKETGIDTANRDANLARNVNSVLRFAKDARLLVVKFGEIESLRTPRASKGPAGLNELLEADIQSDAMSKARAFVPTILE